MKTIILLVLAATMLGACNSNNKIELSSDSTKYEPVAKDVLIVPGQSIGKIRIGQNVKELDSILGKPDFSDAAMGKAWTIWYEGDTSKSKKDEIAIYSSYADSTMRTKDVKQIRITAEKYSTTQQLNTGNIRFDFKVKYPDFKKVATYFDTKLGDTVKVVDSKSNGIAVEFLRGIGRAITVHKKGETVNTSYFTLYPNFKQLPN